MKRLRKYLATALILCSLTLPAQNDSTWVGQWITAADCQNTPNTWIILRKTVSIDQVPEPFEARIAADSKYWMWINDSLVVFEGGLKRGPSPEGTYYDVVDLSPYLKEGENTLAVLLWYFGKDGFSHKSSGKAGFLFDARKDGVSIVSDPSWQATVYQAFQHTGKPYPNYRLPESNIRYDARFALPGWNTTAFKGLLPPAEVLAKAGEKPFGLLVERPIPLWKDYGLRPYEQVRRAGDTLICRLPYNCQMTPYIELEAPAGDTIRIQTDNYRGGSENNVRAEYITREGLQAYENPGWMNGHYVWYILPDGVEVKKVAFRETGYDTEFAGSFTCDDPFLNELWKKAARTLYITMRDTYFDCPDRERAQWWGDAVNELGEAFYALSPSSHKLAAKGIRELVNWQRDNGVLYSPVPGVGTSELPLQMLASIGWYGFYTQYFYSGDSSFVAEVYEPVHRYLHQVWQVGEDGLPLLRKGDWNWGDWGEDIDMGVLTTCWYYLALKAEREFATMLGRKEDAEKDTRMMEKIEKAFDRAYWTGSVFRSKEYQGADDDRAQAMAVVSGLASADKYPALTEALKKEYHASPYMEKYVLEALFVMGQPEAALHRIHERYAKMMGYKDYTTLFEGWGIGAEGFGGGTINHAWSGGPLTMMSQKVVGIEPTSPAFETFRVAPQLGKLKHAEASLVTADGSRIRVAVEQDEQGRMTIRLEVPKGKKAQVVFPDGKTRNVGAGTHKLTGK